MSSLIVVKLPGTAAALTVTVHVLCLHVQAQQKKASILASKLVNAMTFTAI